MGISYKQRLASCKYKQTGLSGGFVRLAFWEVAHIGPKSLILAPQEILDISGYQWGLGCQCDKANNNDIPVTNQKIL